MEERICEVCKKPFGDERPREIDNRGFDSHEIMLLCEVCFEQGFTFHLGEVYIWPGSPADVEANAQKRMKGSYSPYIEKSGFAHSDGAGLARTHAIKGYYRNKRRG